ncbi:MAG: hypothetical protein ACLGH3_02095 [Actinomycetota bacterium]
MRKIILGAIAAAMALSMGSATADPGNGCATGPGAPEVGGTCTYTASGAASALILTPNSVKIEAMRTVDGVETTVVLFETDSANPAAQGVRSLATQAGDKVTVTQGPDCVEEPVCGHIGIVVVGETE